MANAQLITFYKSFDSIFQFPPIHGETAGIWMNRICQMRKSSKSTRRKLIMRRFFLILLSVRMGLSSDLVHIIGLFVYDISYQNVEEMRRRLCNKIQHNPFIHNTNICENCCKLERNLHGMEVETKSNLRCKYIVGGMETRVWSTLAILSIKTHGWKKFKTYFGSGSLEPVYFEKNEYQNMLHKAMMIY